MSVFPVFAEIGTEISQSINSTHLQFVDVVTTEMKLMCVCV